jgi:hypothetical protein
LYFFSIIFILGVSHAQAFSVNAEWNPLFTREVKIECSEGEYACDDLCNNQTLCKVTETSCRYCIGNSVFLTYFFEYIGRSVLNKGQLVDPLDFIKFLPEGNFITINSKSIYNHVYRYEDPILNEKLDQLCISIGGKDPLVFLKKNPISLRIEKIQYVSCKVGNQSRIFQLEDF